MALSSRALAFSVDNLLKSTFYKTNDDAADDGICQHPKVKEHIFARLTDSDFSASDTITEVGVINKKGDIIVKGCSLNPANCSRTVSNKYIKCVLTSNNSLVQDNEGSSKGHGMGNVKEEPTTVVDEYSFKTNTPDAQRHIVRETTLSSLPFLVSDNSERNMQTTSSPSRNHFRASDPSTSSCFCHGEITFCQHPGIISVPDSTGCNKSIIVKLCHADLWSSFHALGTEMIITKSGRRMFPALKVKFCGLDPDKLYSVRLEFLQPDSRKYRYIYHSSRWMVSGSGDIIAQRQCHKAAEEPISGHLICSQIVSFERLKLTNTEPTKTGQPPPRIRLVDLLVLRGGSTSQSANPDPDGPSDCENFSLFNWTIDATVKYKAFIFSRSRPNEVSLVSMQKFQPQLIVEEVRDTGIGDTSQLERYVIVFPQTSFMAVTAYQNHRITTLKIASNPFAKGFRESGKDRIPYESLVQPVSLLRRAQQDYLYRILSPAVLPEFLPHDEPIATIGKKRNREEIETYSCTAPKMYKHADNNYEKTVSQSDTTKTNVSVHSLLYSELHSPLIMSSYLHPSHRNHQEQLIQDFQHRQQNLVPSVPLYLQSVLHHSAYSSSMLAQLTPTAPKGTTQQSISSASGNIPVQPSTDHVSFRPIPLPISSQHSISPLIAAIPSTSAAGLPFPRSVSAKLKDSESSVLDQDSQSLPVPGCTESQLDQLSHAQQTQIRSLNTPMFSNSFAGQQSMDSSLRRRAFNRSPQSPGAFTPLWYMTDQAKLLESKRCISCDYHTLGKAYELVSGVSSLESRHLH